MSTNESIEFVKPDRVYLHVCGYLPTFDGGRTSYTKCYFRVKGLQKIDSKHSQYIEKEKGSYIQTALYRAVGFTMMALQTIEFDLRITVYMVSLLIYIDTFYNVQIMNDFPLEVQVINFVKKQKQ